MWQKRKAGDGNRTHVSSLEGWCSTIELHLHIKYEITSCTHTKGLLQECPEPESNQ